MRSTEFLIHVNPDLNVDYICAIAIIIFGTKSLTWTEICKINFKITINNAYVGIKLILKF